MPDAGILTREGTWWRLEPAARVALLIDGAAYFAALADAMEQARTSITILGWDIRSDLLLEPATSKETLVERFVRLLDAKPDLEIRILIWDWPAAMGFDREFLPQWQMAPFHERLAFVFNDEAPLGGANHEKLVVIDDRLAFVGGIDLTAGRWDTPAHEPDNPCRRPADGSAAPLPFHDLMMLFDGPAAAAIAAFVAERWEQATDQTIPPPAGSDPVPWPRQVPVALEQQPIAIARTLPSNGVTRGAREIEALCLAAIAAAEQLIYIENQYLTVTAIAKALVRRLRQVPALEIVIITPKKCEGPLETAVMDRGRKRFVAKLRAAADNRVRVLNTISHGTPVNVHAKAMIVDDRFITVGSANLANRSMGVDSEVNVAIERTSADPVIKAWRQSLLAEHLGAQPAIVAATEETKGSIINTITALNRRNSQRYCRPLDLSSVLVPRLLDGIAEFVDPPEPLIGEQLPGIALPPRDRRRRRRWVGRGMGLVGLVTLTATWWPPMAGTEPLVAPWIGNPAGFALIAAWLIAERIWRPGLA